MKNLFKLSLLLILVIITCSCNLADHSHIECEICGKCIAVDCDGLEEVKCQGHKSIHDHIACKICGKCIAADCNGVEEEKCRGCQDYEYHEICDICNKCYVPDCSWIDKYKGCSGHIKTVKNHFVTFNENIMDSFEEDSYYEIKTYDEFMEFLIQYDLYELIITMDEHIVDKIQNIEYSKDFFKIYNEEYFKLKSLIIFSFKGWYDYRDICYVADCYYFKGVLNVLHTGGMSQYEPKYECSICSLVEVEKSVIPYINEIEYHVVVK